MLSCRFVHRTGSRRPRKLRGTMQSRQGTRHETRRSFDWQGEGGSCDPRACWNESEGITMTKARDNLAAWLRDAHAMEGQAITLLKTQIDRLENYPEAVPRLREHLRETEQQQQMVEQCLSRLGEDTSTLKTGTMKLAANIQ